MNLSKHFLYATLSLVSLGYANTIASPSFNTAQTPIADFKPPTANGQAVLAEPSNYLIKLRSLQPGDTLQLAPGTYMQTDDVPGLPLQGLQGTADKPITIQGPASAVIVGRSDYNTVRLDDTHHVILRGFTVDNRKFDVDGLKAQGPASYITIDGLTFKSSASNQQIVAISGQRDARGWVIKNNRILGFPLGMYLGKWDGSTMFAEALIENNVIVDAVGYAVQIKPQNTWQDIAGAPRGRADTVIKNNVFHKSPTRSSTGGDARPNLLVGHMPLTGPGADSEYHIYGNLIVSNPTESLFQGEGNVNFYHNVLISVGEIQDAARFQPHNDRPKQVHIFGNSIFTAGTGIYVDGVSAGYTPVITGNAVFAGTPIQAPSSTVENNVTGRAQAIIAIADFDPRAVGDLSAPWNLSQFAAYPDYNRDFTGAPRSGITAGAYAAGATRGELFDRLATAIAELEIARQPPAGMAIE